LAAHGNVFIPSSVCERFKNSGDVSLLLTINFRDPEARAVYEFYLVGASLFTCTIYCSPD